MRARTTVEHLSDYIDVREFYRAGLLDRPCVAKWSSFRWPKIELMRTDSSLIYIELRNQVTPQFINVSWTYCHFGGYRPWIHWTPLWSRQRRLQGPQRLTFEVRFLIGPAGTSIGTISRAIGLGRLRGVAR